MRKFPEPSESIDYINLYCPECDEEYYGVPILLDGDEKTCPICGNKECEDI